MIRIELQAKMKVINLSFTLSIIFKNPQNTCECVTFENDIITACALKVKSQLKP